MQLNKLFALIVFACTANCAKIIPLSSWQPSNPGMEAVKDVDVENSRNSANDRKFVVGRSLSEYSPTTTFQVVDGSTNFEDTSMEVVENQREARQTKPGLSTNKQRKSKNKDSLMSRILPMLVMPFLVSSSLIPMMLTSLKFMLLKSLFVGKIAIVLLALNALWKSDNRGGVYSHNVNYDYPAEQKDLHRNHYGYNGDEEYGAYVNRRRSARLSRFRR